MHKYVLQKSLNCSLSFFVTHKTENKKLKISALSIDAYLYY